MGTCEWPCLAVLTYLCMKLALLPLVGLSASNSLGLYDGSFGEGKIYCGVFTCEVCLGYPKCTDFSCDSLDETRRAAVAMWACAMVFIFIGMAVASMTDFPDEHLRTPGYIAIVDAITILCLATLLGLVAVQPKTKWCDADFSSYDLSFRDGVTLIILALLLGVFSFCVSFTTWLKTTETELTFGTDGQDSPSHNSVGHRQTTPPQGQVANAPQAYPQVQPSSVHIHNQCNVVYMYPPPQGRSHTQAIETAPY